LGQNSYNINCQAIPDSFYPISTTSTKTLCAARWDKVLTKEILKGEDLLNL